MKPWKFCPECGHTLQPEWKHCPECGDAIGQIALAPTDITLPPYYGPVYLRPSTPYWPPNVICGDGSTVVTWST